MDMASPAADIPQHGVEFFAEIVRIAAMKQSVDKGEGLSLLKNVSCGKCGKPATQTRKQLRSGDEGENTVVYCQSCGAYKVLA